MRSLPLFAPHPDPLETFSFTEAVVIMPGIGDWGKRQITIPAHFQDFEAGTRSLAEAPGGVQVRATWSVMRETDPAGFGDRWVLVEDGEVECSSLLMWFVKKSMENAHRDICQKILQEIHGQQEGI